MPDALTILKNHSTLLEQELGKLLADEPSAPPKLVEAIRYSLLNGGKRLRPALVLEAYAACIGTRGKGQGASDGPLTPSPSALAAASAIELIHTFSLVHDDLPAMDDDDLRRGKPTSHKVYGEAMAILAGDAMVTMAFELIARQADPKVSPRLIAELAHAAGPAGMIGGQVLDMAGENQSLDLASLQQIHRLKTGALLTTSARLGAIAAVGTEEQIDALGRFGQHLGLAFQIIDDILDVTSTPEQLGKATNKDSKKGKNTYPALLGLEPSRKEAANQLAAAIDSLSSFGPAADRLRTLAKFVVQRQN